MGAKLPWIVVCAALAASGAAAQGSAGQVGEVVISANGALNAPWEERSVCDEGECLLLVVNATTQEIARVDGRLTSLFKATGSGQEVVRAHTKRT